MTPRVPENDALLKVAENAVEGWNSQWETVLKGGQTQVDRQGDTPSPTRAIGNTTGGVAAARVLFGWPVRSQ